VDLCDVRLELTDRTSVEAAVPMAACLLEIASLGTESRLERLEPGGVKGNARADEGNTFLAIRVNVLHPGVCGILRAHVGLRGNIWLIEAYNVLGPVGCEAGGYTVPCTHLGGAPHLRNVFSASVGQLGDYWICPVEIPRDGESACPIVICGPWKAKLNTAGVAATTGSTATGACRAGACSNFCCS